MEARIQENRIVLPIGTTVTFKMVAKNGQKVNLKMMDNNEDSKFFVLFDENDVDFEIEINNKKCIQGIGYTLVVNKGFYDYYVGPHEVWSMEALYTRGRKLHFISENSEKGQDVIRQTAEDHDISYSESAAVCSRIEFSFEVEKTVPKPPPEPVEHKSSYSRRGLSLACMGATTNTLGSRSPAYGPQIPAYSASNSSSVSKEDDDMSGNSFDSARDLSYELSAGNIADSAICAAVLADYANVAEAQSLAKPFADIDIKDRKQEKELKPNEAVGDKGVVCFGEESNQFYNPYEGFTKDKDLIIKPFVVELRFAMK